MSKSPKSAKNEKEKTKKKTKTEDRAPDGSAVSKGRLIAIEGTRGKDLTQAVQRISRQFGRDEEAAGYSRWDASNTFYEMRMGKPRYLAPPPRTLILLYASDLMFRLRWEIEPALKEGRTVLAAPYVESAIAVGLALGLAKEWLNELFSFAPKPDVSLRLKEKIKGKEKPKSKDKDKDRKKSPRIEPGFVEFCCSTLAATSPDWDPVELRGEAVKYLEGIPGMETVGKKLSKELVRG